MTVIIFLRVMCSPLLEWNGTPSRQQWSLFPVTHSRAIRIGLAVLGFSLHWHQRILVNACCHMPCTSPSFLPYRLLVFFLDWFRLSSIIYLCRQCDGDCRRLHCPLSQHPSHASRHSTGTQRDWNCCPILLHRIHRLSLLDADYSAQDHVVIQRLRARYQFAIRKNDKKDADWIIYLFNGTLQRFLFISLCAIGSGSVCVARRVYSAGQLGN